LIPEVSLKPSGEVEKISRRLTLKLASGRTNRAFLEKGRGEILSGVSGIHAFVQKVSGKELVPGNFFYERTPSKIRKSL